MKDTGPVKQKSQWFSVILGIVSLVGVVVAVWGLQLRAELKRAEKRIDCITNLELRLDVAAGDFDVAYSKYVLALGNRGDVALAQQNIVDTTTRYEAAISERGDTLVLCP